MEIESELDYRQGRIDQAQWLTDRCVAYFRAHPLDVEFFSDAFRRFFIETLTLSVQEAAHGTRSAVHV